MASEHVDRYRRVAVVLGRHGLGVLAAGLGLGRLLPHGGAPAQPRRAAQAREVRAALEELGPTFVKLGQLLSTRRDLLPPEYIAELQRLQDAAPEVPWPEIDAVLEAELGGDVADRFADLDRAPLASASLGQAHAATLPDGTAVVVKVRRPGVVEVVHADLDIVQDLADRASRRWRIARELDLPGLAAEFARSLLAELDYLQEGRNAERFAAAFASDPGIRVPAVHWATTTSRVLTLDRVTGIKIDDLVALDAAGVDRTRLVHRAIDALVGMVFHDGFFHADPHPGNLFVQADGGIGVIDFGMVGRLDAELRERLALLFVAVNRGDTKGMADALAVLCPGTGSVDKVALERDVVRFMGVYAGRPLGEVPMTPLLTRFLSLLRRNRLRLPADAALLVRMLLLVDDIGVRLDPGFDLAGALRPYAARLAASRSSPDAVLRRFVRTAGDLAVLGTELPERLRALLDRVDDDGFAVHLRADELDPLVGRLERIGDRLVVGVITAALIAGTGQLIGPAGLRSRGLSRSLLEAGFGGIGALGTYLAWTRLRRRRGP